MSNNRLPRPDWSETYVGLDALFSELSPLKLQVTRSMLSRMLVYAGACWVETASETLLVETDDPNLNFLRATYWSARGVRGIIAKVIGKPVICVGEP